MLHLAQVAKHDTSGKLVLQLLASQKSEFQWVFCEEEYIPLNQEIDLNEGLLILVELGANHQIIKLTEAKDWILDLIGQELTNDRLHPDLIAEEQSRMEEWRRDLTARSQDLTRERLEIEARREQLQKLEEIIQNNFSLLFETIYTIRNLRAEAEIKPGVKVSVILQTENQQQQTILASTKSCIEELAKVEKLTITDGQAEPPRQAIADLVGTIQVLIPLAGIVEIEALKSKLEKRLANIKAEVKSLTASLNNAGFVNKAPADVVQNTQDALQEAQTQLEILQKRLELLS